MSKLTTVKAAGYMREWMDLTAIKKVGENEEYMYFVAKSFGIDSVYGYRICKQLDSDDSYNVEISTQPILENSNFDWTDAIPK